MTDTFVAPGPGTWQIDDAHIIGAASGFISALFPPSFTRGWAEGAARYGMPVERIDMAMVRGRMYARVKPVGAPEPKAGKTQNPPPAFVMRALCALHPELRRRNKSAARAIAERLWRSDRDEWRTSRAPALRERVLALQSEDPSTLDDDGLRAHIASLVRYFDETNAVHFRQGPASAFPVGDFVVRTCDWTGCDPADAIACLQGSNPSSAANVSLLDRLVDAVRSEPAARDAITGPGSASSRIARMREASGAVSAALDAYLADYGNRVVTGFDVTDRTLNEMPSAIVSAVVSRLQNEADDDMRVPADEAARALRDRVPAGERAAFDEALAEARAGYGLHDEDVGLCYLWPSGLLRRALLECGERLQRDRRIEATDHIFEATPDEVDALLAKRADLSGELARRAAERSRNATLDAPKVLGPQMAPPSADLFPRALGRMMRGMMMYIADANFARERISADEIRGLPASRGVYEGRACVLTTPDDFDRLEPGDVLVAPVTSPAYNVVLPFIGAVVTDRGGALSHAAIVAREFGIPAVVGTVDASSVIPDGAKVRVDGTSGVVEIIG